METLVETLVLHEDGTQTIEYLEGFAKAYPPIKEGGEEPPSYEELEEALLIMTGGKDNELID